MGLRPVCFTFSLQPIYLSRPMTKQMRRCWIVTFF